MDRPAETARSAASLSDPCGEVRRIRGVDGVEHCLRLWSCESAEAQILYLHGIEGHSLWFKDTASFLKDHSINTWALDRRGSGMSKQPKGDLETWRVLERDLELALEHIEGNAPASPVFLMANCWGAKLASLIARSNSRLSGRFRGLVLSSPAIAVKVDLSFVQKVNLLWRLLRKDLSPIYLPLKLEYFTDNPDYLEFIKQDELRLQSATARFLFNTFLLTLLSQGSAASIRMPVLILQAGEDRIVSLPGLLKWYSRLASADKEMVVLEGVKHSLDFHKDNFDYRNKLISWLKGQLSKKGNEL